MPAKTRARRTGKLAALAAAAAALGALTLPLAPVGGRLIRTRARIGITATHIPIIILLVVIAATPTRRNLPQRPHPRRHRRRPPNQSARRLVQQRHGVGKPSSIRDLLHVQNAPPARPKFITCRVREDRQTQRGRNGVPSAAVISFQG